MMKIIEEFENGLLLFSVVALTLAVVSMCVALLASITGADEAVIVGIWRLAAVTGILAGLTGLMFCASKIRGLRADRNEVQR